MPSKADQMPGYVYATAAIPEDAYRAVKAYAKRIHLPMTQAIGLMVVATAAALPAAADAELAARDAKLRELVKPGSLVEAHRHRRRRRIAGLPSEGKEEAARE